MARALTLLSTLAWSAFAVSAQAEEPRVVEGRVLVVVRGAEADSFRADVQGVLQKHHVEVVGLGELGKSELDPGKASAGELVGLAERERLAAIVVVNVAKNGPERTLTAVVRAGDEAAARGTITLSAKGYGAFPLQAKVRAQLFSSLEPLLRGAHPPALRPVAEVAPPPLVVASPTPPPADRLPNSTPKPSAPLVLFSLSAQEDVVYVAGGTNVCSAASQAKGVSCFRRQGTQYLGTPAMTSPENFSGGPALGTTRLLFGADLLATKHLSLGLRLGLAIAGQAPTSSDGKAFFPAHLEGRAAYWLAGVPVGRGGVRPFLFAAGGLAQIDGRGSVEVDEDPSAMPAPSQLDNPTHQSLDVWRKLGSGFAAGGLGALFSVGEAHGILTDLRGSVMFPSVGGAASASLGYAFGL